jgi:flagellar protein FliO/FliZ
MTSPAFSKRRTPSGLTLAGRLLGMMLLLLCVGPMAGAAEDTVLYPRSSATVEAPATVRSAGSNVTLLVLAVAAAAAGGWLLWRQRRATQGLTNREARKLAIAETRSLGNRQYLVVADYDGRKFLLGVCPGRIDLLSSLDGGPPPKNP